MIRDDHDLQHHIDYIHFNPVKPGWVLRPGDWPHSSFHRFVHDGVPPADWTVRRIRRDAEDVGANAYDVLPTRKAGLAPAD